jgi:hypothetical protein
MAADFDRLIAAAPSGVISPELELMSTRLVDAARGALADLADLDAAVQLIRRNLKRFQYVDAEELESRSRFVASGTDEMQATVSRVEETMSRMRDAAAKKTLLAAGAKASAANGGRTRASDAAGLGHEIAAEADLAMQETQIRRQDETLDALRDPIRRIANIGEVMRDELDAQATIMTEFEQDLGRTSGTMQVVAREVNHLIAAVKKSRQLCTLIILIVVCIFLFFALLK